MLSRHDAAELDRWLTREEPTEMTTETTTNHTPGPWKVSPNGQVDHQPPMPTGQFLPYQGIAQVYGPTINPASTANAALIAAAPELLNACESLMEFWDNGTPVQPGALLVDEVRAAIANARGEAPESKTCPLPTRRSRLIRDPKNAGSENDKHR